MVGFPVAALLPLPDWAEFAAVDAQFTKNSPKSRGYQIRDGGYLAGSRVMPHAVTAFALADFLTSKIA